MPFIDDVIREIEKAQREQTGAPAATSPAGPQRNELGDEREEALRQQERLQRLRQVQRKAAEQAEGASEEALATERKRKAAVVTAAAVVSAAADAALSAPVKALSNVAQVKASAAGGAASRLDPLRLRDRLRDRSTIQELVILREILDGPRMRRRPIGSGCIRR